MGNLENGFSRNSTRTAPCIIIPYDILIRFNLAQSLKKMVLNGFSTHRRFDDSQHNGLLGPLISRRKSMIHSILSIMLGRSRLTDSNLGLVSRQSTLIFDSRSSLIASGTRPDIFEFEFCNAGLIQSLHRPHIRT